VRRKDEAVIKVTRNEVVLVDPEGLPGIYMARIEATLDTMSSVNASGLAPSVVKKSPSEENEVHPCIKGVAGSDGVTRSNGNAPVTSGDGGFLKASAGECRPELPEGALRVATSSHKDDLQTVHSSLPVENGNGIQVHT
jgi:hypothetical protein